MDTDTFKIAEAEEFIQALLPKEDNFFRRPESLSGVDLNLACFHHDAAPSLPKKLSASVDSNLDFIPLVTREMLER